MVDEKAYLPDKVTNEEWAHEKCDKYDYMIAAACGAAAGAIDVFFVGDPSSSVLGRASDQIADKFVKKAAQLAWDHDPRTKEGAQEALERYGDKSARKYWNNYSNSANKPKERPESLKDCIHYLEQAFIVPYDAQYAKKLNVDDPSVLAHMSTNNHHVMSLSHDTSIVGLIFSIIDQFHEYGSFIDNGHIIHLYPVKDRGIPYLQGSNLPSRIFCGFVNWLGHQISDLAGSSGAAGRGTGLPMPFYNLLLLCNFGDLDGNTFAETMIQVFEKGYDFRFGAAMAIPVIVNDLMVRVCWVIRQRFFKHRPWAECVPTSKHADLRVMLLIGNATLCVIDGADAAVHGVMAGNVVTFVLHLNLLAWGRLVRLVLKELAIRLNPKIAEAMQKFYQNFIAGLEAKERQLIGEYYARMRELDESLAQMLSELKEQVDKEYALFVRDMEMTFFAQRLPEDRANSSIQLARHAGVDEGQIIHDDDELNAFFGV